MDSDRRAQVRGSIKAEAWGELIRRDREPADRTLNEDHKPRAARQRASDEGGPYDGDQTKKTRRSRPDEGGLMMKTRRRRPDDEDQS